MAVTVINFNETYVSWKNPTGNFTKIRLVRNQNGFPEHSEDGIIIWEENASEGTVSRNLFKDGEDNLNSIPITPGRQIYYRMFLFTSAKVWISAGLATDVVPRSHSAQDKLMNILPKVFTTDEQSPLAIVNPDSTLAKFLDGVSFTYEQFLTFIDLLKPHHSNEDLPFALIQNEVGTLGLNYENNLPTKNQKMLIREALYLYQHKGTIKALDAYVEALTGWAPTTTVSSNLLLSPQDSTFYQTVGNWTHTSAGTLTSDITQSDLPTGTNILDNKYTCKIVASGAGSMSLGMDSPIMKGVPVVEGTDYILSFQVKKTTGTGTFTPAVTFFDFQGNSLTTHTGTSITPTTSWQMKTQAVTSDAKASYGGITLSWSAAGTYFVDMVCLQAGTTAAYDEARAITTFVSPNKTNLINNPSFETNVTDSWVKTGLVTVTQNSDVSTEAYTGSNSAKLVATGPWTLTTPGIPVTAGDYYVISSFFKSSSDLTISLIGKDANGDPTTTDVYTPGTSSDWGRFSGTNVIDAASTTVTYDVEFSGDSGTFYIDCVQFERGGRPVYGQLPDINGNLAYGVIGLTATEYFDGNLPASFGAVWQGTANNSPSSVYYNKDIKMDRLTNTFDDWMAPNLFWKLVSYDGVEGHSTIV
jgi:hypothetical protein